MGNAMTAVTTGDVVGIYNPALNPFIQYSNFSASYHLLSLDRHLNNIIFTHPVNVYRKNNNENTNSEPVSTVGLTAGWLNASVGGIDARDNDGFQIGKISTYENMIYGSFGIKFMPNFSVGATAKYFFSKLYTDATASGLGVDLGLLYQPIADISIGLVLQDIGSKYSWNTTKLYGQSGSLTTDTFPTLRRIGVSYKLPVNLGIVSVDFENSSAKTNIFRFGVEILPVEYLMLRMGISGLDVTNKNKYDFKFALGIGFFKKFGPVTPVFNYAFVIEQVSPNTTQIFSLGLRF